MLNKHDIDNLKREIRYRWWAMKHDGTADVIFMAAMMTLVIYVVLRFM